MQEKNDKKTIIIMLIVIIILIIIHITIRIYNQIKTVQNGVKPNQIIIVQNQNGTKTTTIPNENNQKDIETIKYLSTLSERGRMEYYCGTYFKYLYNEQYTKAYKLLYSQFRETYFPTQDDFEEYIKKTYPTLYGVEYDDISRQGNVYVLRLKIVNLSNPKENKQNNIQRVVIRENGYNDFEMSFQVK